MLALIETFVRIALRQLGPERLPDSTFLLALVGLVYAGVQTLLAVPVYGAGGRLLGALVLDLLLLAGFVLALLRLTGRPGRFRQTLTALFGTGALLGLCMLPLNAWFAAASLPNQPAVLPATGLLLLLVWTLVVNGHIFSRALSAPFAVGLLVAVGYFFLNYLVIWQMSPAAL